MKKIIQNKFIRELAWKMLVTVILTLTAVVTFRAYAAFIEPEAANAPASSDQDFAQNILGANDGNNDFISTDVVANQNGSIIEILEYIQSLL